MLRKEFLDFNPIRLLHRLIFDLKVVFLSVFTNRDNSVWLIGENRGEAVGDNGVWFYRYCREKAKDVSVYFVINKNSAFRRVFLKDKNCLVYGSLRHALIFHTARVVLFTHTIRDVSTVEMFSVFGRRKFKVYLHHGVLGYKKLNKKYLKNLRYVDLFTIGMPHEFEIAKNEMGVDPDKLQVTGYARFDNLFSKPEESIGSRVVSVMLTHRNYLSGKLKGSSYLQSVNLFLDSARLHGVLEKYDVVLYFILHKEVDRERIFFSSGSGRVRVFKNEEVVVSEVIKISDFLITDYSSVAWDFFYLKKPVIFFNLDSDSYLQDSGCYVNIVESQLGGVVNNVDDLIECIEHQFGAAPNHKAIYEVDSASKNGESCKNIYDLIIERNKTF